MNSGQLVQPSATKSGSQSVTAASSGNGSFEQLAAQYRPGWSLPGPFYSDPAIYRMDVAKIWRQGWLFVAHSCELPNGGDYVTLRVDTDSLIVIRGEDGTVRGLHNICRHRGSLICTEPSGHSRRLVCPYHQWTYAPDGKLLACRGMHEKIDKSDLGLRSFAVKEVAGLIYICLSEQPGDFDSAEKLLSAAAKPQGLPEAKVAKAVEYLVNANWKLVWENNRECFHCNANHPQYIKANFDHYNSDDATPQIRQAIARAVEHSESKWSADGLAINHHQSGMTTFPDAERNIWFSANRTPLVEGYVSESMDGQQVAPLMGEYRQPDVGTLRIRTLPNFWNHSSCDHGVSTRLLPAGPERTAIRVVWLVARNAVEGKDYQLEKLMPFWQLTSEQDWEICERQQLGVNSTAYLPGPYSEYKEYNVDSFVRWYMKQLREGKATSTRLEG